MIGLNHNEDSFLKNYFTYLVNFLKHLQQFNPGVIVLGFCFSLNGDVSWLLRRCGLSASMFLTHDLRIITKNPRVELNHIQKQLLKEIGNSN